MILKITKGKNIIEEQLDYWFYLSRIQTIWPIYKKGKKLWSGEVKIDIPKQTITVKV